MPDQGSRRKGPPQDLESGAGGPFSQYLDPTQTATAPQWASGQQPNGWEGKTGGAAFLGTKLLEGITKGRVAAFERKEGEKAQQFSKVSRLMDDINSDVSIDPDKKAELWNQYRQLYGRVGGDELKKAGKAKEGDHPHRAAVMGVLGSVFDKLSGGPFKGDPLTVENMSAFMHNAIEATKDGRASAEKAYAQQQGIINTGIEQARQKAQAAGRSSVTLEEITGMPEVQKALRWITKYNPTLANQIYETQLSGFPSAGKPKEAAGAEYFARAVAPPGQRSQAPPGSRPDAPVGGFIDNPANPMGGPLPAEAPPSGRSVARLGDQSVIRGNYGPPTGEASHEEAMDYLARLAGIGPKEEVQTAVFDPATGKYMGMMPRSSANSFYTSQRTGQGQERVEQGAQNAKDKKALDWAKLAEYSKVQFGRLTQGQQRIAQQDRLLAIRESANELLKASLDERKAPQKEQAIAALINEAASNGVYAGDFIANAEKQIAESNDPLVKKHAADIFKWVEDIKKSEANQQSYTAMMEMLGGKKPEAPPSSKAATPKPGATAATAPTKKTGPPAAGTKTGADLKGRLSGGAPPAASSKTPAAGDVSGLSDEEIVKRLGAAPPK